MRALLVGVLFASSTARADVGWTAPAGCPTAAELHERIDRRIADDVAIGDLDGIAVEVTRVGEAFTARIDAIGAQGRTLTARTCLELADAVAVIVARLASDAHHETHVEMPPESARPARPHHRLVGEAAHARAIPWNAGVRALALTGIGMTPEVGLGADLATYVQRGSRFAEVGYARWAPRPMYLLPGGIGQVDFRTQLIAVRAGWASTKMPLRAWAGVEVGEMHGEGMALRSAPTGRWVAISSGFGVGWPMSPRTRLVGTFEVAVPLQRAEFEFMDGTEVREPAPISARSALGVELLWR